MRASHALQHGDINQISPGLQEAHVMQTCNSHNLLCTRVSRVQLLNVCTTGTSSRPSEI
jgi:hypothetical protein